MTIHEIFKVRLMKKITVLASALMLAGVFQANAQMGIGTPNPSDATMLEVQASDKGVLIPRVSLTATGEFAPLVGTSEESILVYNISTSSDLDEADAVWPGFYYWRDNEWQRIVNAEDLNAAIENLDTIFNENIEQIHDLINYIDPSNPNNIDDNGDPVVTEDHSTVVWDEGTGNFYLVTYDPTSESYVRTIINLENLISGAETHTFIRIEQTTDEPDVYHYFSEEAIKTWMAIDPANNTDPVQDMLSSEPGVVTIDVVGDVVNNFEYILEQEITYEGDTHTIEEIIQMISSEVEGNVIYTEINPGEWVFQYFDGTNYVTIDLTDLVAEAETNTFIKKVAGVVDANDPANSTPTVYYYFSEEAIKDWVDLDPINNTDAYADMAVTEPGVLPIEVTEDVAADFEFILNQEITYEGDTHTIEEIIQMISSEVEGNVIYTEINPGEWVFQYFDGTNYITIDLIDLVAEAETNTFIRIVPETDGPDVYYYFSEEAIKAWLAADSTNTDPEANMPETESGVIKIDVVGDVVENFEYILEQEITYEGDTHTIEEIIQMISSEVEGNVIYTEVNGEWVFQYFDGNDYITIDLIDLVAEAETNTFIRIVPETDGPDVYYYFSEEAIKAWLAADSTNTDPEANMPETESGVIKIDVVGDVVENFEYILEQEITYEGDIYTIEEIIQIISSEVEGNVIYTEVNGEMVFQYYDTTTEEYITINLDELVNELETNTFIRKVDAVIATDGTVTSPTVYYYFSEQAIKDWLAADASNIDPETNMPITATGVTAIELGDDVAANFEYILNQTITYDGDQHTIEEIIQIISSEVEGNVIYINDKDPNDPNAPDNWVFQYFDGTEYVTINLGDLVADLETKTKITRAEITNDGDTPNYVDTVEIDPTVAGQILYKYDSEDGTDYLNITEDLLFSLTNNEEVKNNITNILEAGGGVFFGDITIEGDTYTDVLYYYDDNGDAQLIDVANTLIQNLIDNSTQVQDLKNILGNKYEDNSVIYTGDEIDGNPVAAFKTTTQIIGHTAETTGVSLPVTPVGVVSIELYKGGVLVTNATTDVEITGNDVAFNIGVGSFYQVLPEDTYEVILHFTTTSP